jgi:hypothetical protein
MLEINVNTMVVRLGKENSERIVTLLLRALIIF